ncbi:MAG: DoxX family protein [Thaumarchaeota archaeon]|nr:DoxX family protein [Nitrososphaerota archaeon]
MDDITMLENKFHEISYFGLRLAIGVTFVVVGYIKFDPGFDTYLLQLNLPPDLRYLFALEEFIPGLLLIAGILTRISASVLSVVMLGIIFYIDKASQFIGSNGAEYPVLILAGSLFIITIGPGRISLSHLIKKIPRFLQ